MVTRRSQCRYSTNSCVESCQATIGGGETRRARIETEAEDSDLEEVYNTERHLLYVACTRARDRLLVTSVGPASEFLDDLQSR